METNNSAHQHNVRVRKVDRLSPTRVRVTIEVPKDTVKRHEDHTTQTYARQAKLPGFRPGKAPVSMVKQQFKDDIRKDVVSHLLQAGLGDALESTKLTPLNQPSVELKQVDFDNGRDFEFSAEFEVRPEIELRNYRGIQITNHPAEPTGEEVKQALDSLRERFASLIPADSQQAAKEQFAVVELGYETTSEPKQSQERKQYTFQVGVGGLLPEIDEAIMKTRVGDSTTVSAKFPNDYSEKSLAGREALFHLKVLEIKNKTLPNLDDDFVKQVNEKLSLASLKDELASTIRRNKQKASTRQQHEEILRHLISQHPFEVPRSLVDRQAARIIEGVHEDMKAQGHPIPKMSNDDVKNVHARAEHLVRGSLLLQEVATREKISVNEARYQERIGELATQFQRKPDEMEKMLEGKGMVDSLKNDILTDQVFEFLVQNAVMK